MLARIKGFKVYIVAALIALVAILTGGSPEDAAKAAQSHSPELALVLAAGVALGRALVALFGKLRADGVIQCNPLAVLLACGMLAATMTPLAGCATFEQVRPQTARESIAEAEIAIVGAIQVANAALEQGHLSQSEAQSLANRFDEAILLVRTARTALAARDEGGANAAIGAARAIVRDISIFLSTRAEQRGGLGA